MSTDELCSLMQTERNEIAQNRSYDGESIKSFVTNVHSILCIFFSMPEYCETASMCVGTTRATLSQCLIQNLFLSIPSY